ncbi:hypothetical protein DFH07DRAFT_972777 [Mycena maculata]|uniref:Protein kinase domain-containing protein n=1 Tax=Mycena maculata TaxID=230809 RepID=A0AAD7HFW0_9AGAR|nr:hypothetical protein DFH07DRAFT_972777 [Mycena maculata]
MPLSPEFHAFIHSNHQAYVYRGKLDGETVIIKAYEELRFDGLLHEIRAYNRLRSLSTVPKVIGVFAPPDMAWAALVIEDRGTSLASEHRWETLPLNEHVAIYNAAANVHLAGIHHGDLEARNFVRDKDGYLWIVDFGHATVDHAYEPGVCVELIDLRQNLNLSFSIREPHDPGLPIFGHDAKICAQSRARQQWWAAPPAIMVTNAPFVLRPAAISLCFVTVLYAVLVRYFDLIVFPATVYVLSRKKLTRGILGMLAAVMFMFMISTI